MFIKQPTGQLPDIYSKKDDVVLCRVKDLIRLSSVYSWIKSWLIKATFGFFSSTLIVKMLYLKLETELAVFVCQYTLTTH